MLGVQKKRSSKKTATKAVRKPARKATAKKTATRKPAVRKTVRKTVAKKTTALKPAARKAVAKPAMSCHKHHRHTASCQRVCASSAKRRCGSKSRVRTAHGWRQQLMKLVAR